MKHFLLVALIPAFAFAHFKTPAEKVKGLADDLAKRLP
jgi:hypothetical protein